jgi:hypothetical protein
MVLSVVFFNIGKNIFAEEPTEIKKDTASLSGKVVETMDSGRYTYVCLEKNGEKIWVAVYKITVAVGQNISFKPGIQMVNFESTTLNRKFDTIYFSEGPIDQEGASEKVESK